MPAQRAGMENKITRTGKKTEKQESPEPKGKEPAKEENSLSACDHYYVCCLAYASALGRVQGIPAQAVEATKQGCAQVEQLKALGEGTAQQACGQALDAMGKAMVAYKSMPGFEPPAECGPGWSGRSAARSAEVPVKEELPPCDKYARCCLDYAEALGKIQGVPEQAVEATKQGCRQVEQLKTMGASADQACEQALDAMGQAAAAYQAMPGFEMPNSCQ